MLSIRRQLLLGFAAVLVLMTLNQLSFLWIGEQRAEAQLAVQRGAERQLLSDRVQIELADTRRLVVLSMQSLDGAQPLPASILDSFAERERITRQVIDDLLQQMASSEPNLVAEIEVQTNRLFQLWQEMLSQAGRDQVASVSAQVSSEFTERLLVDQLLPRLMAAAREQVAAAQRRSGQVASTSQRLMAIVFGGSLLIGILVAMLVSRNLLRGIEQLRVGTLRIGDGDFSFRLPAQGSDEFSQLARNFNQMGSRLEAMTADLRHANATLQSRAEEIARQHDAIEESARELVLFYRLIDQTEDALLIVDLGTGKLMEVNSAACDSLGYLKQELVGESFADNPSFFFGKQTWAHLREAVRVRNGIHLDWQLHRKDGSTFPAEIRAREVMIGNRAYLVAVARDVTNAKRTERQLREQGRIDALTGISNRRHFDEQLQGAWKTAAANHKELALLLVDIDHYKAYNDHLGHQAGDRALRDLAQAMAESSRSADDAFCRYGGEEFALLLSNAGLAQARAVAKRLHTSVRELRIPHPSSSVCDQVTISVGISSIRASVELGHEQLVEWADKALYLAKSEGRNRTAEFVGTTPGKDPARKADTEKPAAEYKH